MKPTQILLRINALSCLSFGIMFLLIPAKISNVLGQFPEVILRFLGIGLILHAAHLLYGSFKKILGPRELYYFSASDQAWMLATLLVLTTTDWITTGIGINLALIVAIFVSTIGLFQLWTYAEHQRLGVPGSKTVKPIQDRDLMPASYSRWKSIGVSWLGMKLWVKIWLFALNGVFLAVFLFWPTLFSKVVLMAYISSLPLLLSFMIAQRGLTRLLGLAHLIPWVPLLVYIWLRFTSSVAGPLISFEANKSLFIYGLVLFTSVTICLAFDLYDVIRWRAGRRACLGSATEKLSS